MQRERARRDPAEAREREPRRMARVADQTQPGVRDGSGSVGQAPRLGAQLLVAAQGSPSRGPGFRQGIGKETTEARFAEASETHQPGIVPLRTIAAGMSHRCAHHIQLAGVRPPHNAGSIFEKLTRSSLAGSVPTVHGDRFPSAASAIKYLQMVRFQ